MFRVCIGDMTGTGWRTCASRVHGTDVENRTSMTEGRGLWMRGMGRVKAEAVEAGSL